MMIPGDIFTLIDVFSFAAWLFYGSTMGAVLVLRYTWPNVPRPYRVSRPLSIHSQQFLDFIIVFTVYVVFRFTVICFCDLYSCISIPLYISLSFFLIMSISRFFLCCLQQNQDYKTLLLNIYIYYFEYHFTPLLLFDVNIFRCIYITNQFPSFVFRLFLISTTPLTCIARFMIYLFGLPQVPTFIPVVVLLISAYLVVAPIIQNPRIEFLYATIFIFSGLIFYVPFVVWKVRFKFLGE